MKKYFLSILIIMSVFLAPSARIFADASSGFIPGQIWYSNEKLIEGETVNIHTAVWNGEKNSISMKVEFYDKNIILGSREVTLSSLELKDVYIPWKVTSGDHIISAKITSSMATISGQKEKVVLDNIATESDRQSVSVLIKNANGDSVINADKLEDKLEDTGSKINELLPENVSDSISSGIVSVEDYRVETSVKIDEAKEKAQKEVDQINSEKKDILQKVTEKVSVEESSKKPIAYVKLYFFSILAFIFANKIIFYGVIILVVLWILRSIYRRIRNR